MRVFALASAKATGRGALPPGPPGIFKKYERSGEITVYYLLTLTGCYHKSSASGGVAQLVRAAES